MRGAQPWSRHKYKWRFLFAIWQVILYIAETTVAIRLDFSHARLTQSKVFSCTSVRGGTFAIPAADPLLIIRYQKYVYDIDEIFLAPPRAEH
jgi:hypothetical protein